MPKILRARAAQDERKERRVRKLAASRHGPADWILHAQMVVRSWDGERAEAIAQALHCDAQTVRRRLPRFETEGIEGLGDRPKAGRTRRLTAEDDSKLIALAKQPPPGRLVRYSDGSLEAREEQKAAQWSLDALAQAAKEAGISVKRSQLRTILRRVTVHKLVGGRKRRESMRVPDGVSDYLSKRVRSAPPRLRKFPHQASRRLTRTALAGTL